MTSFAVMLGAVLRWLASSATSTATTWPGWRAINLHCVSPRLPDLASKSYRIQCLLFCGDQGDVIAAREISLPHQLRHWDLGSKSPAIQASQELAGVIRASLIVWLERQTLTHPLQKPIPLETPATLELEPGNSIRVTLFNANHCPGAVMFRESFSLQYFQKTLSA